MTYQQVICAINDAAHLAAQSVIDAFGDDPEAEFPSADIAWDFLNNNVCEDGGIERPLALPDCMPRQFSTITIGTFATSCKRGRSAE